MEIELTAGQLALAVGLVIVALALLTFGMRYLIKRRSNADLNEQYGEDLKARNKYPDVNAFKYPPTDSILCAISKEDRFSVPLNNICSRKWVIPA